MTSTQFSHIRQPRAFIPAETRVLVIDDSSYTRAILMEVLRGVGITNDHVSFQTSRRFLEGDTHSFWPDVILVVHASEEPPNFDFICDLRRLDNANISEKPIIFLSALATQSNIVGARDSGADEFMARPVSPEQVRKKMKKVIENPQPFISSPNYVGPCRRRKASTNFSGPRRRLDDFQTKSRDRSITANDTTDELVSAITELRSACGELSDERTSLIARVRDLALKTMRLARETNDTPLFQTATAVKYYLDGVGTSHLIEPHVLETGINALTQLSTLPSSYDTARTSVASLMTFAVRKKLAHYQKRRDKTDPEMEDAFRKINDQSGESFDFVQKPDTKAATS